MALPETSQVKFYNIPISQVMILMDLNSLE